MLCDSALKCRAQEDGDADNEKLIGSAIRDSCNLRSDIPPRFLDQTKTTDGKLLQVVHQFVYKYCD